MDKLAAMRAFVAIVDRGSLSAAALALGRSLPTMVRLLAALERSLGVVLLRRTTRRMSLTPEGRVYLERCRRILADVAETEDVVGATRAEPRGRLRVTAPVLFGQMHVAPAVTAFLAEHPAVQIDLVLVDRVLDLVEDGIDAAVRIARLPDSSAIAIPVGTMRRVVCASPELLRRVGTPERPEDLAGRPCVRFHGLASSAAWHFEDSGRPIVVPIDGPLTTNQAAAAVTACVAGLGFGVFLSYQVAAEVAAERLCVVLPRYEPPPLPVSLVYPEARIVFPRLRIFLDWMTRHLRGQKIGALAGPTPARRQVAPSAKETRAASARAKVARVAASKRTKRTSS